MMHLRSRKDLLLFFFLVALSKSSASLGAELADSQAAIWTAKDYIYIDDERRNEDWEEGSGVRLGSGNYDDQAGTDEESAGNQEGFGSGAGILETTEQSKDFTFENTKVTDHALSFFSRPGMLAAVIGGVLHSLLCVFLVAIIVLYRIRKDRRSYAVNFYTDNSNYESYA